MNKIKLEKQAKEIYEKGEQHYREIADKLGIQSDIIFYATGFIAALMNDKALSPKYKSIVGEEAVKEMIRNAVL